MDQAFSVWTARRSVPGANADGRLDEAAANGGGDEREVAAGQAGHQKVRVNLTRTPYRIPIDACRYRSTDSLDSCAYQ
jgi:hypothetical protein